MVDYPVAIEAIEFASKALGAAAFVDVTRFASDEAMASEIMRHASSNGKR